jgi:hypothetical protein
MRSGPFEGEFIPVGLIENGLRDVATLIGVIRVPIENRVTNRVHNLVHFGFPIRSVLGGSFDLV